MQIFEFDSLSNQLCTTEIPETLVKLINLDILLIIQEINLVNLLLLVFNALWYTF